MKIAIGCDHTSLKLKKEIMVHLEQKNIEIINFGTDFDKKTHYPIYGRAVALCVAQKKADWGIILCGTGAGIAASANKIKGIRAALVNDVYVAIKSKTEYNANVIAFGGRITKINTIIDSIDAFIETKYQNKNKKLLSLVNNKIKTLNSKKNLFKEIIQNNNNNLNK